ncbi:hypothetical protein [Microbaculum marinum]|uniref:Uncharacterized protein n=1 Tax=Microbaculum marinum TaxID=1764581 RepID=A0AAW9REB5_9HYPH
MTAGSDPRAGIKDILTDGKPVPTAFQVADYMKFYETPPSERTDLQSTWYGRGQNFIVAYTVAEDGAVLEGPGQSDEYMVVLPDRETAAMLTSGGEDHEIAGYTLTIVPPGASSLAVRKGGVIVRIFSSQAPGLADLCLNRDTYATPDPNVAPYAPWPAPRDGYRVRVYDLNIPPVAGRFGRIFQSSNLMVNVFYPQGPRDVTKMSPHHHDDFQQGWMILEGECVHHVRWPWTADLRIWRDDEHVRCGGPSLAVVPPPSLHTTQMTGERNVLLDIFSPPRTDFVEQGWVLNHDEYRLPEGGD